MSTKALCTLNLYHLFDEEETALKSIDVSLSVDNVPYRSRRYSDKDVESQNFILQSPVYRLRRMIGIVSIKAIAWLANMEDPIGFCIEFEYRRGKISRPLRYSQPPSKYHGALLSKRIGKSTSLLHHEIRKAKRCYSPQLSSSSSLQERLQSCRLVRPSLASRIE